MEALFYNAPFAMFESKLSSFPAGFENALFSDYWILRFDHPNERANDIFANVLETSFIQDPLLSKPFQNGAVSK